MSLENPIGTESTVSGNSKIRRTFLKRASAGAIIASIPGRSAWAGMAGSIVASGHGSDFQQGVCTKFLKLDTFNTDANRDRFFKDVFGAKGFNRTGRVRTVDLTFGMVYDAHISSDDNNKNVQHRRGINRINVWLFAIYLNAESHNGIDIIYPIVAQHGGNFAFADYLYNAALNDSTDRKAVADLLRDTYNTYSNSSGGC